MSAVGRRCIIFDLDQCVIQSFFDPNGFPLEKALLVNPNYMSLRDRMFSFDLHNWNSKKGEGNVTHAWGVTRPHFKEFLLFCRSYFDVVCVWTAGDREYGHAVVDKVFSDIREPDLVYTRDDLPPEVRGNYHKPIQKMLADPRIKDRVSIESTIFVDDKWDNFASSPENGIRIPEWKPAPLISNLMSDDIALLQLRQWLLQPDVMRAEDIRKLVKSYIFISPLIAEKKVSIPIPRSMYSDLPPVSQQQYIAAVA
jgi:hypothetical protein